MAELRKNRGRRPLACKGEIDTVDEVGIDGNGITDDINPSDNLIIALLLFPMQGEQHHHADQGIGVEDGGRIKDETGTEQFKGMSPGERAGIYRPIRQYENHATDHEHHVDHQQVPQQ